MSKQPIPAIRHWWFNEVNSRPNTPSAGTSIRTSTLSSDNCRLQDTFVNVTPPVIRPSTVASSSATSQPAPQASDPALVNKFGESRWSSSWDLGSSSAFNKVPEEDLHESEDEEEEEVAEDGQERNQAQRKRYASDSLFDQLKSEATQMLKEVMRWEGRGGVSELCGGGCEGDLPVLYRCTVCKNPRMFCRECMVERHLDNPFDRIQYWNGRCFETTTLAKMGLCLQVGHPPAVELSYCGCQHPSEFGCPWQQLLRSGLFPATIITPHTAFTIRTLKLLHGLTIAGKMTTYQFYQSIEAATDVAGVTDLPTGHYDELTRVLRMWRYLRTLKRGGVGSTTNLDLSDIPSGSLAVVCPACPDPKINLPDNWMEVVQEKQFLHYKFLSVDACFRLKHRRMSSEEKDLGIFTGKAYFVE
ncbi:hypothetical protein V5O48_013933 [Marasmius crinis-equi]|uniref:CxC2-like cysteine cluster KDZ transposase-associated domain-containing protein n=1 Tax=Marasmius crinis-equi TaxID=585013 RepID=A0ABR3EYT0_9AGAR